ncbi:hypothetical protein KP509_29G067300 [Ceratopteris richardii]|uniref:Uncharacterized protein n=1 Tax=Ceratopteris richardii TaxID=49495 RepID=A0A8T2R9G5_CERRI|nr:hypothetical protein KP509_29G067300 [Ceratopteris richardii]
MESFHSMSSKSSFTSVQPDSVYVCVTGAILSASKKLARMDIPQSRRTSSCMWLTLLLLLPLVTFPYVSFHILWILYPIGLYIVTSFLIFVEVESMSLQTPYCPPNPAGFRLHEL